MKFSIIIQIACRRVLCKNPSKAKTCGFRPIEDCDKGDGLTQSGTFSCKPELAECPDCKINEDGTKDLPECKATEKCPNVKCDKWNVAYG